MKRISSLWPWMACLFFYGCGGSLPWEKQSAPRYQDDAGLIASCTSVQEAQSYAQQFGIHYRVLSSKHRMIEFFDKDHSRLQKHFPRARINQNRVYENLIDSSQSEHVSASSNFSHLDQMDVNTISHRGGLGITIAVIDTGVSYQHQDLKDNLWVNNQEVINGKDDDGNGHIDDIKGWDFIHGDNDPYDDNGHGTHVAGLAVGKRSGVATQAKFMPLKVLDATGGGDLGSIVSAILYAVEKGANIVNLSLGGSGGGAISRSVRSMISAVRTAKSHNTLIVAAAGNGGNDGVGDCNDAQPIYPASINEENLVAVAAIDSYFNLSSFSNFGTKSVHIAAPGGGRYQGVLSTSYCESCQTQSGYQAMSGTSMATPLISGVLAVLMSESPNKSAIEIRNQLLNGATKIDELTDKVSSGGYANLANVLRN